MSTEMEALIFAAYHGELTDAERDELSQWVASSPANARLLIEYANDTRGIEIALRSDQAAQADETIGSTASVFRDIDCDVIVSGIDGALSPRRREEANSLADQTVKAGGLRLRAGRCEEQPGGQSRYALAVATLLGIAALVGVAFWIGEMGQQPERQDDTAFTAPILVAPGAEEQPENIDHRAWSQVAFDSDLIHFTNDNADNSAQTGDMSFGFVAYTFENRGTVVVEGPVRWQMLKDDAIRLFEGRLVAMAVQDPYAPLSFLIDLTEIKVQGAEFGLYRTGPDTASIIVFEGSIEVSLAVAKEQAVVQTIEAGQVGILQTRLGTVEKQSLATPDDLAHFSNASGRLRYRPLETTRSVYYRHNPPRSLLPGEHDYPQYSGKARLIRESVGVTVADSDLANFEQNPSNMVMLSTGQAVDSYILHFEPTGGKEAVDPEIEGMVEFARPILAVLGSSDSLRATDARYGSPRVVYPRSPAGVNEVGESEFWGIETDEDSIQLSADRKRLFFKFNGGGNLDQVRLLLEAR